MTDEKNMATDSHYAPWDLRRLPNFDFSEYLHKIEKPDGKGQTAEMTLEGTKRWFRLACPNGALVLNALRVTDAMAIFEARVFADANDRNPLASFTATQKADKAKGDAYIRAAQDAALEEALKNAGFCLQISTLARVARDAQPAQANDAGQPSETPKETAKPSPAPAQADAPRQEIMGNAPAPKPAADSAPRPAPVGPPPHAAPRPAPVGPQPHAAPAPKKEESASTVVDIGDARQAAVAENKPDGQAEIGTQPVADAVPASEAPPVPAPVTYTADMTVDEITARMTLEQAQSLVVKDGTCKGWTLAQVAKDRPTSLRWLQGVCPFADNELKAAATIVLNDLELKMAG